MATAIIPCTLGRYTVSDDGRVFDRVRDCEVIPHNDHGYLRVHLTTSTGSQQFYVHRLVAESFLTGRSSAKRLVNHKNNDLHDNRAENLAWVTPQENVLWHGGNLLSGKNRAKTVIAIDPSTGHGVEIWSSVRAAARAMKVSHTSILHCVHGLRKTCCGYFWRGV